MLLVSIPDNAGKLNYYHIVVQETKVRIRSCYECSHTVSLRQNIMHVRHFVLAVRFVSFRLDNAVKILHGYLRPMIHMTLAAPWNGFSIPETYKASPNIELS